MNQSNKAETVHAKNYYFSDITLIKKAMVEAYCLTLVKLVICIAVKLVEAKCLCALPSTAPVSITLILENNSSDGIIASKIYNFLSFSKFNFFQIVFITKKR